jgi:hypothetical protein
MSNEQIRSSTPKVPISYSHDSPEHKKWVGEFASKLVAMGVDVILDQWDLGLGDDVAKFMEKAVSEADRVLMICTEIYVRKADDGKGGVGYEAMVVTGELVKNLGTAKFIPIVRQQSGQAKLPKCVSTRFYVNFSEGQNFDEQFETLLRELHNAPKVPKPPLGKNPFAGSSITVAVQGVSSSAQVGAVEVKVEDAEAAYATGIEIARRGDFVAWRHLVRKVKEPLSARLGEWRLKYEGARSIQVTALPAMVLDAAAIYSPLMGVALAGLEAGNAKFNNQIGVLDELLRPKGWNSAGPTVVGSIPNALVFTYQALHGATCLEVGELSLAIALTRTRVIRPHHFEGVVVHRDHQLIGLPESFAESFSGAWNFLVSLAEKWSWLQRIFGSGLEYKASLCGYYMALSVQELALMIADGKADSVDQKDLILEIPALWVGMDAEIQHQGYRRLVRSDDAVRDIWRSLGVSDKAMAAAWGSWVTQTVKWIMRDHRYRFHGKPVHAVLFEDIRPREN